MQIIFGVIFHFLAVLRLAVFTSPIKKLKDGPGKVIGLLVESSPG